MLFVGRLAEDLTIALDYRVATEDQTFRDPAGRPFLPVDCDYLALRRAAGTLSSVCGK